METVYADTLGKDEKDVVGNTNLYEKIQKHMAGIDAAFTSFNGTLKSIKQAIDPQLNVFSNLQVAACLKSNLGFPHQPPTAIAKEPPKGKSAKAKAKSAAAPAEPGPAS